MDAGRRAAPRNPAGRARAPSRSRSRACSSCARRRRAARSRRPSRPGPALAISTVRSPGTSQRGGDGAVDDEQHLPRVVPLAPEDLALRARVRRRSDPRQLAQVAPRLGLRGAERWRGSRRSRGQTSRSRVSNSSPPGVSSAVSIEYSGTSSHVEKSVVSGSEAMISRAGRIAGRHLPVAVAARRTRPRSHTRGSRTGDRSRASRPRADTSRSRTRSEWQPRRGRC